MTDDRRGSSFDELAKGLASGAVSRRQALRLMGAALVGGTLASIPGIAWAAPRPKPNGKKCKSNSQCASGNCVGGVCQGGCPSGTTECFSQCVPNCQPGQILNPSTCQCIQPDSINVRCVCRDGSGGTILGGVCFDGLTCPDFDEQYRQCVGVCGGAENVVNWSCNADDFCFS